MTVEVSLRCEILYYSSYEPGRPSCDLLPQLCQIQKFLELFSITFSSNRTANTDLFADLKHSP